MKNTTKTITLILALSAVTAVQAAEFTVGQKDKKFTQASLDIAVGDTVHFQNDDPFSHNVYSLSEAASFDLGSYPKGNKRSVKFEQAGKVEVGCAIHLDMMMDINVK